MDLFNGSWAGGNAEGFARIRLISGTFTAEVLAVGAESDVGYTDGNLVGGISNYLAHKMLDLIFNGVAYTGPDTYLGMSTVYPGDDGAGITEPSGNNYARQLVDNWTAASDGVADIGDTVTMNTPSGGLGNSDLRFSIGRPDRREHALLQPAADRQYTGRRRPDPVFDRGP